MPTKGQMYMEFLAKKKFQHRLDSDGDVIFQYGGMSYVLMAEETDPRFVRILLPAFWKVDSDIERSRALEAINEISLKYKVTKMGIVSDRVVAMAEFWMDIPKDLYKDFERILKCLSVTVKQFYKRMIYGMEVEKAKGDG